MMTLRWIMTLIMKIMMGLVLLVLVAGLANEEDIPSASLPSSQLPLRIPILDIVRASLLHGTLALSFCVSFH